MKSWLIRKDPDAGKSWGQEENGVTVNEMDGWRLQLKGHEFKQTPGEGERQGSLSGCSSWGRRVRHNLAIKQQQQQQYTHTHTHTRFPGSLAGRESTCNAGDPGSIPGLEKSPGEGIGYPLQYSCLENPRGQRSLAGYSPRRRKEQTWPSD